MSDSEHTYHNGDLALQKYLLLHEQHESLRQHLDTLRPLHSSMDSATTPLGSPSGSPTQSGCSNFSSGQTSPSHWRNNSFSRGSGVNGSYMFAPSAASTYNHNGHRRSSAPPLAVSAVPRCAGLYGGSALETVPDESTLIEVAAEERKLFDVNEGIKRALTELLNCETTRSDRTFRTWVQCRLMDTEKELRSGRRRRSAPEA